MINVGIIGATGYAGQELIRLLLTHPHVAIHCVTSRAETGRLLSDFFPQFRGLIANTACADAFAKLAFVAPDSEQLMACDTVFFATPHGMAHALAEKFLNKGIQVIDLSADFRLKDADLWEQWYGQTHGAKALIEQAVYGLAEYNAEKLKSARLMAIPGCYPTVVQLGLLPAMQSGYIETTGIIADCKTGVSGAGRKAAIPFLQAESAESIKAYAITGHRHQPEIEQGMALFAGQHTAEITFMPHLTPMIRGIQASIYVRTNGDTTIDWQELYEQAYENSPFVEVLPQGQSPETRHVKGTNKCHISLQAIPERKQLIIFAAIDNLVKGTSGQAMQCFNLANGFSESLALPHIAVLP